MFSLSSCVGRSESGTKSEYWESRHSQTFHDKFFFFLPNIIGEDCFLLWACSHLLSASKHHSSSYSQNKEVFSL